MASAFWADNVGDTGFARGGWEGTPRAVAKLLAMEVGSRCRARPDAEIRGGCCGCMDSGESIRSVDGVFKGRDSGEVVSTGIDDGHVVSGWVAFDGCSCLNLSIWASLLWWSSSS